MFNMLGKNRTEQNRQSIAYNKAATQYD